jgi:hypothetical protein
MKAGLKHEEIIKAGISIGFTVSEVFLELASFSSKPFFKKHVPSH